MAMTITEKIFAQHIGRDVKAGEIIRCDVDMTIGNDITHQYQSKHSKKVELKSWQNQIILPLF